MIKVFVYSPLVGGFKGEGVTFINKFVTLNNRVLFFLGPCDFNFVIVDYIAHTVKLTPLGTIMFDVINSMMRFKR